MIKMLIIFTAWKTDLDNPAENTIAPIAETDPWGSGGRPSGGEGDAIAPSSTIDEGWANFDSFNNFDTATFNGIPSSDERTTSNFFGTFTQKFDFTDSDPMINSPLSTITSGAQQNVYDEQKHNETSSSADDNANISNNCNLNSSESSSSIDNFHTCLSNALKTATPSEDDNSSSSAPIICNDLSKSGDEGEEKQSASNEQSSNETTPNPT